MLPCRMVYTVQVMVIFFKIEFLSQQEIFSYASFQIYKKIHS
jgi:hypothetical protein